METNGQWWSQLSLAWIPKLDAPGGIRVDGRFGCGWPIHFGDERRVVPFQKAEDAVFRCDEGMGKLRIGRVPNHHQQGNSVLDDCREFVWFVADAAVMGNGHPAALADFLQPDCVGAFGREVVRVPLDVQTGDGQDFRKAFTEVAVSEKNVAQAACS